MVLAERMQTKLENCITWLVQSGMKVNEAKTGLCLFYARDTAPIEISINDAIIKSSRTMNVLGVMFDQKLQWSEHISLCTSKSMKALSAIRMIKKYFPYKELLEIVTANVYSIIYYNSEIWHLPSLKSNLKQKLLSISARAISTCVKHCTRDISFVNLHLLYKRATPEQFLMYRHALCIYKVLNSDVMTREWLELNFNQVFTSRQTKFITLKTNNRKVGLNALANRAFILNNKIPLEWINMSLNTFKVYCKKEFLI